MESQLLHLFDKAVKAAEKATEERASGGPHEARCLDAIKAMADCRVTTSLLISTQVGKRLRTLMKHSQPRIQRAATDLIDIWKKLVAAEAKNGVVRGSDAGSSSAMSTVTVEKSISTVKVEKVITAKMERKSDSQKSETVKPVLRAAPVKLASIPKTNDTTRDKIREMLVEALARVRDEANEDDIERALSSDPVHVGVSVETVLFGDLGLSTGANKLKYRSIMFNIRDNNNPDFRRKVLFGDVRPDQLVNMTAEEMASDQRKAENKQIKEKALFECERGNARQASTDQFKCAKCKQRKCTYFQMQTRSADEPMTTFVTCVNCNNRWKFC